MDLELRLVPTAPGATAGFDRSGRHLTVYLSGELDAASTPVVADQVAEHLRPDDQQLSFDLSALTFCDSTGLTLLFRLERQASEAGARFALFDPTPPVRRIIEMCDASGVLNIRS